MNLQLMEVGEVVNNDQDLAVFPWKVGGHHTIKLYRDSAICKQLNRREFLFYQQLPDELRSFVPKFEGIVTVESCPSRVCCNTSTVRSRGSQVDSRAHKKSKWSVRCSSVVTPGACEYLVLENLTYGYNKPCVLDLKIGTRMYGDFATQEKIKSQQVKAKETTSGKLGLRVCGFQRYSQTEKEFQKVDKYAGRRADEEKFRQLLETFFTIKGRVQTSVIRTLVNQCKKLRKIIAELDGFRFYSSSLLILYEGGHHSKRAKFSDQDDADDDTEEEDQEHSHDEEIFVRRGPLIKLIDFANVAHPDIMIDEHEIINDRAKEFNCENKYDMMDTKRLHIGPDTGFLLGLDNLLLILKGLIARSNDC